jgi:hypothetical protein
MEIRSIEERTGAEMQALDKARLLELVPMPSWVNQALRQAGLSKARADKAFQAFVSQDSLSESLSVGVSAWFFCSHNLIELFVVLVARVSRRNSLGVASPLSISIYLCELNSRVCTRAH